MFGKFNQNDEYQQPWLNMCNPEIWINLNLPKLHNNYLQPVPRLWDLGIGNFMPSEFPGFEWVRNNKVKANLLTFPETSIWPITFCKFGSKYNVPLSLVPKRSCTLHKRKEHTKAARTTQAINNRNLIESFENIPVPPGQCHLVWVCLLGPSQPGVVTGTASLRFQSAYHI